MVGDNGNPNNSRRQENRQTQEARAPYIQCILLHSEVPFTQTLDEDQT